MLGVNVRIVVEYARKNGIDLSARYKERYSSRNPDADMARTNFYRMRVMEELQNRQVVRQPSSFQTQSLYSVA